MIVKTINPWDCVLRDASLVPTPSLIYLVTGYNSKILLVLSLSKRDCPLRVMVICDCVSVLEIDPFFALVESFLEVQSFFLL